MKCSTPAAIKNTLQEENSELRTENTRLKEEIQVLLQHSIEPDTRLLQYTEEVFVANIPSPKPPCQTGGPPIDTTTTSHLPVTDNYTTFSSPPPHDTADTTSSNQSQLATAAAASAKSSPIPVKNNLPSNKSVPVLDSAQDYPAIIASNNY